MMRLSGKTVEATLDRSYIYAGTIYEEGRQEIPVEMAKDLDLLPKASSTEDVTAEETDETEAEEPQKDGLDIMLEEEAAADQEQTEYPEEFPFASLLKKADVAYTDVLDMTNEDLAQVHGISSNRAQQIRDYLDQQSE